MSRLARIAYGLTALLLLHLVTPTIAWLAVGAGFLYVAAHRRRRPPLQRQAVMMTR